MFLYFDINGNLKEIVFESVREGNVGINKLHLYIEPANPVIVDNKYPLPALFTGAKINYKLLETGINLINNSQEMSKETVQIPFNPQRDLKFFKYGFLYETWSCELPSAVTAVDGVVTASAFLYNLNNQLALNKFNFNVEDSVGIVPDGTITESQYSYLYNLYQQNISEVSAYFFLSGTQTVSTTEIPVSLLQSIVENTSVLVQVSGNTKARFTIEYCDATYSGDNLSALELFYSRTVPTTDGSKNYVLYKQMFYLSWAGGSTMTITQQVINNN